MARRFYLATRSSAPDGVPETTMTHPTTTALPFSDHFAYDPTSWAASVWAQAADYAPPSTAFAYDAGELRLSAAGDPPYLPLALTAPVSGLWLMKTMRAFVPAGSNAEVGFMDIYPADTNQYVGVAVGRNGGGRPTLILSTNQTLANVDPSPGVALSSDFQNGTGLFSTYLAVDLVSHRILVACGPAGDPGAAVVVQRADMPASAGFAAITSVDAYVEGAQADAPTAPWSQMRAFAMREGTISDNPFGLPL